MCALPRVEEGCVRPPVRAVADQVTGLGMRDQQRTQPRGLGHRLDELSCVEWCELLDAAVEQEALEPEHAGVVQRL
jgi:hypothetical protein